jgi:hypothetical protein
VVEEGRGGRAPKKGGETCCEKLKNLQKNFAMFSAYATDLLMRIKLPHYSNKSM